LIKKTDSYLSLLAINKKLTEQHDKDNLEISELKLKLSNLIVFKNSKDEEVEHFTHNFIDEKFNNEKV
jgi:hypothetical protein